jgi:hypothetical protein
MLIGWTKSYYEENPEGIELPAADTIAIENQPQPSLESDIIDNLAHPTTCNLIVLVGGDCRMEVRRGLVYPNLALLDDVLIDTASYVVVKVDMLHENVKNLKFEVPPDDTTLTLHDVVTRKV